LFAEEAAIGAVQFCRMTKCLHVALEGMRHMDRVVGISRQHLLLRDKAFRAFSKKDIVAERCQGSHLAPPDQAGLGSEGGIDLLGSCQLFAIEYAAARLIDYAGPQTTIVCDLLAEARDGQVGKQVFAAPLAGALKYPSGALHDLLSNTNERPVYVALALLPLP